MRQYDRLFAYGQEIHVAVIDCQKNIQNGQPPGQIYALGSQCYEYL